MALTFVGGHFAAGTSVATTNNVGDLLVVCAFRSASATPPTLPGTYTAAITAPANGGGGTNNSAQVGWRRATASNEGSGTWTNATAVLVLVYRGALASGTPIGGAAEDSVNSTSAIITYPAITLTQSDGSSALAAFGMRTTTGAVAGVATAPSGMTNAGSTPATPYASAHYQVNRATNWPSTDVTPGGTNVKPIGVVLEILAEPPAASSVDLPAIASGSALGAPTTAYEVALATIAATVLFAPTLAYASTLPAIASGTVLSPPAVAGAAAQLDATIELVDGTTVRATRNVSDVATGLATYTFTLTDAERDSVTDWSNVRLRVTGNGVDHLRVTYLRVREFAAGGAQNLTLPLIGPTGQLTAPTVIIEFRLSLPAIPAGSTVNPPSTALNVTLPSIGSTVALTAPSLAYQVQLPTRASTLQLFAPTVRPDQAVSLPVIVTTGVLHPPTVTREGAVALPTIASTTQLFSLTLTTVTAISLPTIGPTAILTAPSAAGVVALPTIPSSSTLYPPMMGFVQLLELPTIPATGVLYSPGFAAPPIDQPTLAVTETTQTTVAILTFGLTVELLMPPRHLVIDSGPTWVDVEPTNLVAGEV